MEALKKLQYALDAGAVSLSACDIHKGLSVLFDRPDGTPRFTYAVVKGRTVIAVCMFALTDPIDGSHCFQLGYAVVDSERQNGLGSRIVAQAIDELRNGLARRPMKEFYLEAIVSASNGPSSRIAQRLISDCPKEVTDGPSGEPALQYLKKVTSGA